MDTQNDTSGVRDSFMKSIDKTNATDFSVAHGMMVTDQDGQTSNFEPERLQKTLVHAANLLNVQIDYALVMQEVVKNIYDGVTNIELLEALILSIIAFAEKDTAYSRVAARLLQYKLFRQVTNLSAQDAEYNAYYRKSFIDGISYGVSHNLFDQRMLEFDLEYLSQQLDLEADKKFSYMGMRTLYERYFIRHKDKRVELPQTFWMRVAMGISYNEPNKNEAAVTFYNLMSRLRYVPSTPTLLHAGLTRPQLSSCFLSTVEDDLRHIFKVFGDNAQLSKWSGGVSNDWTNIRATGAMVKSIKTESQGVIPFIKIVNDTTAAINRSGKRRGATSVYLETWHLEIEDFLDLRRNTGDERRRAHDINTANWIPDLFMKRVDAGKDWTLFSPEETPDLHHLYGKAFEQRYAFYEEKVEKGELELFKKIPAKQLWRKMLSRLFETGHPWITFKDACNVRSPQDHAGVVHCSNLCTEITLNTSSDETAVCNLGSVNLANHASSDGINHELLAQTVADAIRMLDNVIDINFYPTKEAKDANLRHRPIGLGIMGFQDALYKCNIMFDKQQALTFADNLMEEISYNAILASSKLAKERGTYGSYHESKWDRGIFPQDTLDLLEQERGIKIDVDRSGKLDWQPVRDHVKQYGMRNSNCMAIAPTATISNISDCYPCIEPIYKNMYVKANMSGEFTVVNKYLVEDLKKIGLWTEQTVERLKYFDGSLQMMEEIPQGIRDKYKEVFEIDPLWLIKITAARGKWIDQSQSHNVFMSGVSGKKLYDIYMAAWKMGLKTTYYLRTLAATQIEKSTLDTKYGFTQKREYTTDKDNVNNDTNNNTETDNDNNQSFGSTSAVATAVSNSMRQACSVLEPDCDVCQ